MENSALLLIWCQHKKRRRRSRATLHLGTEYLLPVYVNYLFAFEAKPPFAIQRVGHQKLPLRPILSAALVAFFFVTSTCCFFLGEVSLCGRGLGDVTSWCWWWWWWNSCCWWWFLVFVLPKMVRHSDGFYPWHESFMPWLCHALAVSWLGWHGGIFQAKDGILQIGMDFSWGSIIFSGEVSRHILFLRGDLPKGAEWMIRGAYTPSFRINQHPLEDADTWIFLRRDFFWGIFTWDNFIEEEEDPEDF